MLSLCMLKHHSSHPFFPASLFKHFFHWFPFSAKHKQQKIDVIRIQLQLTKITTTTTTTKKDLEEKKYRNSTKKN